LQGLEVINDTLTKTVWLGMPSKEDLESTQSLIMLDDKEISEPKMERINSDKVKSTIIKMIDLFSLLIFIYFLHRNFQKTGDLPIHP
jgi:hypothetical protein